jgi:SAM-dependent methyltransferase
VQQNKAYWNELADIHVMGTFYPVEAVVSGNSTLRSVELALLAKSSARRVLHSHCHIGLDTVSIARTREHVTGLDFSEQAITHAREIAFSASVANCDFFVADSSAHASPERVGQYDLYFASYGVLVWVPDVTKWFRAAASYLCPRGELILIDEHPIAATFDGGTTSAFPIPSAPYYEALGPYTTNNKRSYSGDPDLIESGVQVKWPHSMADLINGALAAGFSLVELDEHPFSHYRSTANMTEHVDGYYRYAKWVDTIPFLFSLVLKR